MITRQRVYKQQNTMHTDQRLAVRLGHAGELAVQDVPGLCVGCREDVSIGVDRRLDARVAQAGLNHMDGHTGHQQMACVNMPEVVQSHIVDTARRGDCLELVSQATGAQLLPVGPGVDLDVRQTAARSERSLGRPAKSDDTPRPS